MTIWRVAIEAAAIAVVEAASADEAAALARRCALELGGKRLFAVRMAAETLGRQEHHALDVNGARHASRATMAGARRVN